MRTVSTAADFLWREFLRHGFDAEELKVLFCILRRARWYVARFGAGPVEVFEARFDRRWFTAWTGIRSDHVLGTLRDLDEARVIVPRVWLDGVYQVYAASDGWKVKAKSSAADAAEADGVLSATDGADRRGDLAPEPGVQLDSLVAVSGLGDLARGAADVAAPGRAGGSVPPAASSAGRMAEGSQQATLATSGSVKGSLATSGSLVPRLLQEMRRSVEDREFPGNGSSFPGNGSESPGFGEGGQGKGAALPESGKIVPDSGKSLPDSGMLIRNVRNGTEIRTDVTFKELPDSGKHAIEELTRFLGSREVRRYAVRFWYPAALHDPDGLLEHARWLLDLERTGKSFGHRGKYAWGAWQKRIGVAS